MLYFKFPYCIYFSNPIAVSVYDFSVTMHVLDSAWVEHGDGVKFLMLKI